MEEEGGIGRKVEVKSPTGVTYGNLYLDFRKTESFDKFKNSIAHTYGIPNKNLVLVGLSKIGQLEEMGPDNFTSLMLANSFVICYTTLTIKDLGDSVVNYFDRDLVINRFNNIDLDCYDFENKWTEGDKTSLSNENDNNSSSLKNILVVVLKTPGNEYTKEVYVQKNLPDLYQILVHIGSKAFEMDLKEVRLVKDTAFLEELTKENVQGYLTRNRTIFVHSRKSFNNN